MYDDDSQSPSLSTPGILNYSMFLIWLVNKGLKKSLDTILIQLPQVEYEIFNQRLQVLKYLYDYGVPLKPGVIAKRLNLRPPTVRAILRRCLQDKTVSQDLNGCYYVDNETVYQALKKIADRSS